MEAVILCAGYATRLYPLTKDIPKPLLQVGGRPIVEHILPKLKGLKSISKVYIVTNSHFYRHFDGWLKNFHAPFPIEIVDDGTKSNEERLGAIGDINHIISNKKINDDIVVIAGDNIFEFSIEEAVNISNQKKSSVIVVHDVKDRRLASHYGVVDIDKEGLVAGFEEKPQNPKSTLVSTGIYVFPKKTIRLIEKYISEGNSTDKTGHFIEWLHKREKVYTYITEKPWYDIGSHEQLEKANNHFRPRA